MSVGGRRRIHRLSAATVERIAAGEVVERPASVVKELVENAMDAGATEVRIRLEAGGLELVEVSDNGSGIPPEELMLAVERHATSKLGAEEALEGVDSLGFRGEALAAIAAVSRLRLTSRPSESDEAHGVSLVGGQLVGEFVAGRAVGTTVEVSDLFFNTPARRKFMGSAAAEQVEVTATIERAYLARPSTGLTLMSGEREVARFPPADRLEDAAAEVQGPEFLPQSFRVDRSGSDGVGIEAVVARPALHRSTSEGIFLSVNGRAIQSRALSHAVRLAFIDHLPRTRFPLGVVHLHLDARRVDVNVHPTKREVRIAKEREVADLLRRSIRESLLATPQVAELAGPALPALARGAEERRRAPSIEHLPPLAGSSLWAAPAAVQRRLLPDEESPTVAGTSRHPSLRLLGSLFSLYWVAEGDDGLVLVDQHAASERVLFDALLRDGRLGRQALVEPVRVTLTSRQRELLSMHAEEVRSAGFDVEPFGGDQFRVRAVPSYRGRRARPDALAPLLDELAAGGRPTVPNGMAERRAATVACHAAVRGGDRISSEEMGRILEGLYGLAETAYACPHGRPILVKFPRGRLDRLFLRSGA
ncbi:MAG: DNA mismatch repair endonuclease MutL [Thermoplasmata archaeon]|nr:DNA mismatch repair endonuclease MutL [Thermoplasmata archaeon]